MTSRAGSTGSGTGASTPHNANPAGVEFSALKTLVEVSLGLSSLVEVGGLSRAERSASPGSGARFDPKASIVVIGMRGVGKVGFSPFMFL